MYRSWQRGRIKLGPHQSVVQVIAALEAELLPGNFRLEAQLKAELEAGVAAGTTPDVHPLAHLSKEWCLFCRS